MKLPISNFRFPIEKPRAAGFGQIGNRSRKAGATGNRCSAFTMIEIAICLAIIAFALVAIIGNLPAGLNVQKKNREETIINQDAAVWMNVIRNGARGYDDLVNYVTAITNNGSGFSRTNNGLFPFNYGSNIIGLLSTPKNYGDTNYMAAYVRAFSGSAVEKVPQDNPVILDSAFSYKMIVEVFSYVPYDPNSTNFNANGLSQQQIDDRKNRKKVINALETYSHDVRLTFRWPLLPNGAVGNNRQTFRALIGGQMLQVNDPVLPQWPLYFIQPPSYANAP